MLGLTTTRRLRAEVAAAKAEADRQRRRAETAEGHAATAKFNREQALRQNAELDAANRRLAGRNVELGERISKLTEADPQYAAQLERRIARLRRIVSQALADRGAEKKRADRLQARLDDAVGLTPRGIKDSRPWQPGYQKPKADKS
jgi:chromosome segregation ATPase